MSELFDSDLQIEYQQRTGTPPVESLMMSLTMSCIEQAEQGESEEPVVSLFIADQLVDRLAENPEQRELAADFRTRILEVADTLGLEDLSARLTQKAKASADES